MAPGKMIKCKNLVSLIAIFVVTGVANAYISTLEDLPLAPQSFWNGSDQSSGFTSGSAHFSNNYNPAWGSWDGFSYSNITDTTTTGMAGQYNAIAGTGQGNSANYAIGYVGWAQPPIVTLSAAGVIDGLYVTNNNYAYYSMLYGDAFAKKFGGPSGNDEDWFLLTITGKDAGGSITGTADFYLADYRFADNNRDYIVSTWGYVDLTSLGIVKSMEFSLSSSDAGAWGMNTPAYFALDTIISEPATMMLVGVGGIILFWRRR